ncbi:phosphatase PAP2 family protein [Tannerella sp.]|uniref:phosphatase PAP2 family protein n=1 Tax=Tannerella sp. TaxID=2382127 RepID=UPI0026DAC4C3|nr:phosphatase PAP2 family protein [Tannerella sp.]MDO4702778.1 phosphatase PAP2 family protein [Tannerella sp.]
MIKRCFLSLFGIACSLCATHAEGDTLGVSPVSRKLRFLEENSHITTGNSNVSPAFSPEGFSTVSLGKAEGRKRQPTITRFIVPTLCIAYGTAARFNESPIRRFDKHIARQVNKHIDRHYGIDNSLQIMPAAVAWGLDFVPGVEARHNFRDRTLILATSYSVMFAFVYTTKDLTGVERPRQWGEYNAFPSGHTAVAFTGAHILYKEYRDHSPWIGVGGYAAATAVGALRVINNAHWVSDVIAGAGVGILSAEIGYLMLPVWHRLLGINGDERQFALTPQLGFRTAGLGVVYVF